MTSLVQVPRSARPRRWRNQALLLAGAAVPVWLLACGERATGPDRAFQLGAFRPALFIEGEPAPFPAGSLSLVLRTADGVVVADTAVAVPAGSGDIVIELQVSVASGVTMLLADATLAEGGTTLFAVQRTPVELRPIGATAPAPSPLTMAYVGPGAGTAASVRITAPRMDGFSGDTIALQGEVLDAQGAPIPGVPVVWSVRDTLRVRVPGISDGRAVLGGLRGPAQVFLRSYTGLVDSVEIGVAPLPAVVEPIGSFPRADTVGAPFGAPVGVRLMAADQLPVAGIDVRFVMTASGATVLDSLVPADENGQAFVTPVLPTVAGVYTLTATPQRGAGSAALVLTAVADAPDALGLTGGPTTDLAAGEVIPPLQVSVRDRFGNVVASFGDTVEVRLVDGDGTDALPPTRVLAVQGVATAAAIAPTLAGSGYRFSVTAAGLPAVQTALFDVLPAAASTLVLTSAPAASIVAGTTFAPLVVEARDAFGNVATGLSGQVSVAIGTNPTAATLGGTTSVNPANGIATFDALQLTRAGSGYTLVFATGALASDPSAAFDVTPAAASALRLISSPDAIVIAGEALSPLVVGAGDAYGNEVGALGGTVTVAFAANPGNTALGGTLTMAPAGGVATFADLSVTRVASGYTLIATAAGLAPVTTTAFTVEPAAAAALAVTTEPPASVEAGAPVGPVDIDVVDAFGNLVPTFAQPIVATIGTNPSSATLSGTASVAPAGGTASFTDLLVTTVEAGYTLAFASGTLTGASSTAFAVTPGPAAVLAFTAQPVASLEAGTVVGPLAVTASDGYGNVATGFTGQVAVGFGANPSATTLGGTDSVAAAAGVATFGDLVVTRAAAGYTLAASSGALVPDTTTAFTIVAAAPSVLAFTSQPPATTVAGTGLPALEVEAQDPYGNRAVWADSIILDLGVNPAGGELAGTLRREPVTGTVTFDDLLLTRASAGYTLVASSGTLTDATSDAFAITAAPAARLQVATEPASGSVAGSALAPFAVEARDAYDNLALDFTDSVALRLSANPSTAALIGTRPAAAVAGVATFADVIVGRGGTGYAMETSSSGLLPDTTVAFDVMPPTVRVRQDVISTGFTSCALAATSSLHCWGVGTQGNLGDSTVIESQGLPRTVFGGRSYQSVSTANSRSCALEVGGAAYCWGANNSGSLGIGAGSFQQSIPAPVVGGLAFAEISTGTQFSCARTTAGAAYCWGANGSGQLGDNSTTTRTEPTAVSGGLVFASIRTGNDFACGLTSAGIAYCWGANDRGQLGDGRTILSIAPSPVVGGLSFTELSIGYQTVCALISNGSAYCWGWNFTGSVGDGTTVDRALPTSVLGEFRFDAISAGGRASCGLMASGQAWCWGDNSVIGNGATELSPQPVLAAGGALFSVLSSGSFGTRCGVTPAGDALCWGANTRHETGDGFDAFTSSVVPSLTFTQLAAGRNHWCGIADAGAYCWGFNSSGQVGDGTVSPGQGHRPPQRVVGGVDLTSLVRTTGSYSCGLDAGGAAYCWGAQFGDGTAEARSAPVPVSGGLAFSALAGGFSHMCGIATDGLTHCWGSNVSGQLGDGTQTTRYEPAPVLGSLNFVELMAGWSFTCGRTGAGTVHCWGGVTGDGTTGPRLEPAGPVSGGITFASLSAGYQLACGMSTENRVYCWGSGSVPTVRDAGFTFERFAAGSEHYCGVVATGTAYCWGSNRLGDLGDGTTVNRVSPVLVRGITDIETVDAGFGTACGLDAAGRAHCWGRNVFGQRGLGLPLTQPIPITVAGGITWRVP